ncbi:hypothetical protein GOEFS_067_00080 [Gordonia effusa NBRC 100432]|uniref:Type II secretion system protein GspF domain-containing protein n=1 Tax=Gordonia effusa NBRC 100432 TaxID=1077974 RepID=H0R1A1_9ACTN|nr:type II secretion system F family protein [Gordonia effusa]GAB18852.1 hypothetical protein GOEFS_067_00080 [Gordonia effusa NBRC 100432]
MIGWWCVVGALTVVWWPVPKTRYRLASLVGSDRRGSSKGAMAGLTVVTIALAAMLEVAVVLCVAILLTLAIWLRHRSVRRRRDEREREALATALSAIAAELSIGTPPPAAFASAGQEVEAQCTIVGHRLRTAAACAALGGSVRDSVGRQRSSTDHEWRRIALAWEIAHEFGVPIKDLLEAVRSDLNARCAFAARTAAGLAGPRATATVLSLLPVLGIGLGQALGAQPIGILCGGGIGGVLLVVGVALDAVGVWWSLRIADHVVALGSSE